MSNTSWVVDVTTENFQEQVVSRSHEIPVVVDFWAEWCGPCRALGPVLEALAQETPGRFLLGKVNTDENPDLAQAFQIEGIPAVFAVKDGQVVDQFTGVISEAQVREFLDRLTGKTSPDPTEDARVLEDRDPAAAIKTYREKLRTDADNATARIGLARMLLAKPGEEAEASQLLVGFDPGEFLPEVERLKTIITLRNIPHSDADLVAAERAAGSNENAAAKLQMGRVLAARGNYTAALEMLLSAAEDDRTLGRDAVRELMVEIFNIIGSRSPESDDFRSRLQSILY